LGYVLLSRIGELVQLVVYQNQQSTLTKLIRYACQHIVVADEASIEDQNRVDLTPCTRLVVYKDPKHNVMHRPNQVRKYPNFIAGVVAGLEALINGLSIYHLRPPVTLAVVFLWVPTRLSSLRCVFENCPRRSIVNSVEEIEYRESTTEEESESLTALETRTDNEFSGRGEQIDTIPGSVGRLHAEATATSADQFEAEG
jgi:hypothetical protein